MMPNAVIKEVWYSIYKNLDGKINHYSSTLHTVFDQTPTTVLGASGKGHGHGLDSSSVGGEKTDHSYFAPLSGQVEGLLKRFLRKI